MPDERPSPWREATEEQERDHLALEILLLREFYELTGRWMTPRELQRALRNPGL